MDVVDLRNFYAQHLGVVARRFVGRGIRARWNDARALRVVGIGYATPYLGLFRGEAERCLALMPAPQGVVRWPSTRPALAALVEEDELPLTDSAVDRVLLVHALEMSPDPVELLRETWRFGCRRPAIGSGAESAGCLGAHGHDPVRSWPALFADPDHTPVARHLVHADRLGRGALRAADPAALVFALGGRLGAHWRYAVGTIRRRAHRGSNQAGLSHHSGAARATQIGSGAQAGIGALAWRDRDALMRIYDNGDDDQLRYGRRLRPLSPRQ